MGLLSREACCRACRTTRGCRAFHLKAGQCALYGHGKVSPAVAMGGKCYGIEGNGVGIGTWAGVCEGGGNQAKKKIIDSTQ